MAKFIPGPTVTQVINSLGTTTFYRSRNGNIQRSRVTPKNELTGNRLTTQALWKTVNQAWSGTATDAQRLAWNELAAALKIRNKLGDNQHLTGQQLFALCGMNKKQMLFTPGVWPAAPTYLIVAQPTALTLTITSSPFAISATLTKTTTPPPATNAGQWLIQSGAPTNPGRYSGPLNWRYVATNAVFATATLTFTIQWSAIWGTPTSGKRIHIRVRTIHSVCNWGSPWIHASALVP